MNDANWKQPLQSFDIKTIHSGPADPQRMRVNSLVSVDSNYSETHVGDCDFDVPEAPHAIVDICSNSAVLGEMKGYPRTPLGTKLFLHDRS